MDKLRNADQLTNLWTEEHTAAFNAIKAALQSAPYLSRPDLQQPFYLATDAFNDGIGCVLYQIDPLNNQHKHIGFHARALPKSEHNYSTTKRELLAIVFALKKYHQFLLGNHFTLR